MLQRPKSRYRRTVSMKALNPFIKNEGSEGTKCFSHCLAVPGDSREHHATGQLQARSPWQREEKHHFLLQPLNLSPGVTVRSLSSLTSTSRGGAAITSLSVLRGLTATFLTNVLSSACLSSSQGCRSPSALNNTAVTSPVLRRASSQRKSSPLPPPAKWVFYYPERG